MDRHSFEMYEKKLNEALPYGADGTNLEVYCDWLRAKGLNPSPDNDYEFCDACFKDEMDDYIRENKDD